VLSLRLGESFNETCQWVCAHLRQSCLQPLRAFSTKAGTTPFNRAQEQNRITHEVRRELMGLPYYGFFDYWAKPPVQG